MKLQVIICGVLLTVVNSIFSQDFYYKDYNWASTPETIELSDEELKMDEISLKRRECLQLLLHKDQAVEFRLIHNIIRLNTDLGIERYNKWYVSNMGAIEMRYQKARVIKPNGTIVELNSSDIKEFRDENGDVEYKYFAFEGIEKGSLIEVLELGLYPARLTGSKFVLQNKSLSKNIDVEIITPAHLVYLTHPVNEAPAFENDTTTISKGFRRSFLHIDEMKPLKDEDWSAHDANLQKIYYKLYRNLDSKKANFYSYSDVSHNIHSSIFTPLTKKETALIKKFLKSIRLNDLSEDDKIRAIENEIKQNYYIVDQSFQNSDDITSILTNKVMNDDGFFKLFVNSLKTLDIPLELVVTCDRYKDKFTVKYEAYNFLTEYLLYLPNSKKFLSHDILHRYGFIPYEYTHQKGLFIREIEIQGMRTAVSEVKDIHVIPAKESIDQLNVRVELTNELTECSVDVERISTGYKAQPYQTPLDYVTQDQQKEIKEEYITYIASGEEVEKMSFENDKTILFGQKPLVGRGAFKSKTFLERGGDKVLLKVGLLIGPQSELYNREARVLPVESPYPREYNRSIEVVIPEGYTIQNLEELKMNVVPSVQTKSLGFVSDYTVQNNVLRIEVKEWYNDVFYQPADYLSYEQVINAAADFNKLIIVLEKN